MHIQKMIQQIVAEKRDWNTRSLCLWERQLIKFICYIREYSSFNKLVKTEYSTAYHAKLMYIKRLCQYIDMPPITARVWLHRHFFFCQRIRQVFHVYDHITYFSFVIVKWHCVKGALKWYLLKGWKEYLATCASYIVFNMPYVYICKLMLFYVKTNLTNGVKFKVSQERFLSFKDQYDHPSMFQAPIWLFTPEKGNIVQQNTRHDRVWDSLWADFMNGTRDLIIRGESNKVTKMKTRQGSCILDGR